MGTHALERRASRRARTSGAVGEQLGWLGAGLVVGFVVPFVFADRLGLPRDVYYGVYTASVIAFFTLWSRRTGYSFGDMLRRRWRLALVLGLAAGALMAFAAARVEDASTRPDGLELIGAVLWRGVVYGAADGFLLSAFPILAVFAVFDKRRQGATRTVAVGLAALVASMAMTAAYHLGYAEFRSGKVASPVAGDVVWSVPTLATLNPVGAPIAHAGLHVSAVLHSYETDLFLPPHE